MCEIRICPRGAFSLTVRLRRTVAFFGLMGTADFLAGNLLRDSNQARVRLPFGPVVCPIGSSASRTRRHRVNLRRRVPLGQGSIVLPENILTAIRGNACRTGVRSRISEPFWAGALALARIGETCRISRVLWLQRIKVYSLSMVPGEIPGRVAISHKRSLKQTSETFNAIARKSSSWLFALEGVWKEGVRYAT
jgi:hypothetical protein